MSDDELNALFVALETAYDLLKSPVSNCQDLGDFEARRRDAFEKVVIAMKAMDLDIDDEAPDQPAFTDASRELG